MRVYGLDRVKNLEARKHQQKRVDMGPLWQPLPGPQMWALESEADIIGYGGAGGGGKTDLLLGAAFTQHRQSILFRREFSQLRAVEERSREIVGEAGRYNRSGRLWRLADGRTLELGAAAHPGDERRFRGRPHDLIAVDEAAEFLKSQVLFLLGWLRTTIPGQRCRAILAFNPPSHSEGEWILDYFGAWLDPKHPHPAQPGELRWYAVVDGEEREVESGAPFTHEGETLFPQSRTFFPAFVTDNPYLMATGYVQTLQALPEPLRSQLLKGDFTAGREDNAWQVIPTAWIKAAMARWTESPPEGATFSCVGVDVARGGQDKTVICRRYGTYFARLEKHKGSSTPDGPAVAALVQKAMMEGADSSTPTCEVNIDVIGWGAGVYDILRGQYPAQRVTRGSRQESVRSPIFGVNFAAGTKAKDKTQKLSFLNVRAEAYWRLREALDPESGQQIALPPDNELLADLAAPRWSLQMGGIKIEAKEEIEARIGRSPDCGDVVALAAYVAPRGTIEAIGGRKFY